MRYLFFPLRATLFALQQIHEKTFRKIAIVVFCSHDRVADPLRGISEKFAGRLGGYGSLMRQGPIIHDAWMQIESQGLPVGYSHTW